MGGLLVAYAFDTGMLFKGTDKGIDERGMFTGTLLFVGNITLYAEKIFAEEN
jgi:hypothetical protein